MGRKNLVKQNLLNEKKLKLSTYLQMKCKEKLKVLTSKFAGWINSTFSLLSPKNNVNGNICLPDLRLKLSTFSNGRSSVSSGTIICCNYFTVDSVPGSRNLEQSKKLRANRTGREETRCLTGVARAQSWFRLVPLPRIPRPLSLPREAMVVQHTSTAKLGGTQTGALLVAPCRSPLFRHGGRSWIGQEPCHFWFLSLSTSSTTWIEARLLTWWIA